MKLEQKINLAYVGLGIASGFISNIFPGILSFVIPIVAYVASVFFIFKKIKGKKKLWYVSNTLLSFLLIWLLIWILLFNTKLGI